MESPPGRSWLPGWGRSALLWPQWKIGEETRAIAAAPNPNLAKKLRRDSTGNGLGELSFDTGRS